MATGFFGKDVLPCSHCLLDLLRSEVRSGRQDDQITVFDHLLETVPTRELHLFRNIDSIGVLLVEQVFQ